MSAIVIPNIYSNGEVIDAGQLNSNFSAVTNVVNGNIDNTNLSSSLAITDSHLNQIVSAAKVSGTALTGLASIPSGAGIIPAANLIYSNIQYPYVKISNTQASGTNGGNLTSGSWLTLTMNTLNIDTANISSLGSNAITLPAGNYYLKAKAALFGGSSGNTTQVRLYNSTSSATLNDINNNVLCGNGSQTANNTIHITVEGIFTLSTSSAIIFQYQSSNSETNGQGAQTGYGPEVYSVMEFTKIQ